MRVQVLLLVAAVVLGSAVSAQAAILDNFDQPADFDPAVWSRDVPNAGLASITLDTTNDWAHFAATGGTDMWGTRNNAPILWTTTPTGPMYAETHVMMPAAQNGSVAGLTVYDNVDGAKPNFALGLDQWGSPLVKLQGIGTNNPGIATAIPGGEAWLRLELYRDGGAGGLDRYVARYKLQETDPWTPLAVLDRDVPNARMGMFLKTNTGGKSSDFSYFASDTQTLPDQGTLWSVDIQTSSGGATAQGVEQAYGRGNVWNAFEVAHHSGTSTNLSMPLVNSDGDPTSVAFSILGTVSGWNNNNDPLRDDYLFVQAGFADQSVGWEISGLTSGETYELFAYGGPSRNILLTVDQIGQTTSVPSVGTLFGDILVGLDGKITGTAAGAGEGNWSGFQLRLVSETAVIPEPASICLMALGLIGILGVGWRRRRKR